jgi:hypothetical protein
MQDDLMRAWTLVFSGLIYFDEYEKIAADWQKETGFFLGTCMALGGIFVLTSDHAEHEVKRASEVERKSLMSPLYADEMRERESKRGRETERERFVLDRDIAAYMRPSAARFKSHHIETQPPCIQSLSVCGFQAQDDGDDDAEQSAGVMVRPAGMRQSMNEFTSYLLRSRIRIGHAARNLTEISSCINASCTWAGAGTCSEAARPRLAAGRSGPRGPSWTG